MASFLSNPCGLISVTFIEFTDIEWDKMKAGILTNHEIKAFHQISLRKLKKQVS